MRFFSAILLTALSFAAEDAYPWVYEITASTLNLRAGPSENYEIVSRLPKGARVVAEEETAGWLKVRPPEGMPVYVHGEYVSCGEALPESPVEGAAEPVLAEIKGDAVRVRAKPSLTATMFTRLSDGAKVTALWREGDWCALAPPEGVFVWLSEAYATRWGSPAQHEAELEAERRRQEEEKLAVKLSVAAEERLVELESRYGAERTRTFPDVPMEEMLEAYGALTRDYPGTVAGDRAVEIAGQLQERLPAWRAYVDVDASYRAALEGGSLRRQTRGLAEAFRRVERDYGGTTYGELAGRKAEELEVTIKGGNRGYVVGRAEE